jgi:hypothetical protein
MIEHIFHELEKHLSIKAIKDDKSALGQYCLPINETLSVWVKELTPGVLLKTAIGPLSLDSEKETLFAYLMKANFIGQGTGGAIIALDPEEKILTLSLIMSYEVNYRIFRDRLEEFINYLEFWKSELQRLDAPPK